MKNVNVSCFFSVIMFLLLTTAAVASGPVVTFDESHGQKFLIGNEGELQLSKFAALFKDAGFTVSSNTASISDMLLEKTNVLVLSGPFKPFSPEETAAVLRFVERGGKVCIMIHIPGPLTSLLSHWKVFASNGVIEAAAPGKHKEIRVHATSHPVVSGTESFAMYGVWALLNESKDANVIASTGTDAWIDLNRSGTFDEGDAKQSFGVVVEGQDGKGNYIIFADDALFQNKFLTDGNLSLARNLVKWLKAP